jgi:hypothetical protein
MRRRHFLTGMVMAMVGALGSAAAVEGAAPTPARPFTRIFWSGHSLTDQPLPGQFAAIAQSLGRPVQWNAQMIYGSHIKARSRGDSNWDGFRQGQNRSGSGLDVKAELRAPRTVTGGPYDALIITEQHTLLGNLIWNDTIRHLRFFHDRAIDGNPRQTSFLYQSWLGIDDPDDPRQWIAYEKAAAMAWHCVAARINRSLAAEKRPDRIEPLDAGAALAMLVERAMAGKVAGLGGSPRQIVEQFFRDDVHLTPLGNYFVALYVFAELAGAPPTGAWAPPGVAPATAAALQNAAWSIRNLRARVNRHPSLEACSAAIAGGFSQQYLVYLRGKQARSEGMAKAYLTWARHRIEFGRRFNDRGPGNPLVFDAATDRNYWFAAP